MTSVRLSLEHLLRWLTGLFFFILPWGTIWLYRVPMMGGSIWQPGVLGWYASEALLWCTLFVFMAWYVKRVRAQQERVRFAWSPDRWLVASLLAGVLFVYGSLFWAADPGLTLTVSTRILAATLFFCLCLVGPLSARHMVQTFVAGAIVSGVLGLWQFVTQSTFASTLLGMSAHPVFVSGTAVVASGTERWLRAYGSFAHPNVFGGYMTCALVVLLVASSLYQPTTVWKRIVVFATACVLVSAVAVSWSRGAVIATLGALGFLLIVSIVRRNYWMRNVVVALCIFLGTLGVIAWPLVAVRTSTAPRLEARSIDERVRGYHDAVSIIRTHEIRGVGAGQYTLALQELHPGLPGYAYEPVHNVLVLMVAEYGMIGICLFVFMLVCLWRWLKSIGTRPSVYFVIWGVVLVVLMMTDHYLLSSYVGLMLLAGVTGIMLRLGYPQTLHTLSTWPKKR